MTAALRDAGHDGVEVVDLQYEPMHGIVGVLGEVGVFTLQYASDTQLPAQLLGKCPLDHDTARLYNSIMRYYRRETRFYRDLADAVPMRVPRCYVNLSEGENHILLLEYVADATPGDVLAGTSFEKMQRLIGDMARMHGRFWMDRKVRGLEWMFLFTEDSLLEEMTLDHPVVQDLAADRWALFGCEAGFEQFRAAVVTAFDGIVAAHPGQRVAVFCHGTVIGTYLTSLLGHDDPFVLLPDYCGIYRVKAASNGLPTLRSANETAHVRALAPVQAPR